MTGLGSTLVLFFGVTAIIGVPVAVGLMRGPLVLRVVRVGGIAYAALIVLITAGTVIPLIGGTAQVSVPLQSDPLKVPNNVSFSEGPLANVTGGGIDRATLMISHLGIPSRLLLIGAAVAIAAVSVVIALTLSRIAAATLRGAPFVPSVARAITIAAVAIVIGGTLSAVLQQWGEWSAGQDALSVTAWTAYHVGDATPSLAELGWPAPADFTLQIPFIPLLLGLGLGAVAAVFRAGERLQRDTDGLV